MSKNLFLSLVLWCMVLPSFSMGILSGKVLSTSEGNALPGATIYINEFEKGAISNADGTFILENIPNSAIKVEVSFIGYETKIISIDKLEYIQIWLSPTRIETPEVVVTGSNFSSQHENAIKIESISADKLVSKGSPSFVEMLSSVPGVDVIGMGNGIGKPVIRGLSNSNLLFLNNGVKMENYQFSENHPYVIDEVGVGKIEIIKGPASLLYGSDAIGGLINVLPERPATSDSFQGDISANSYSVSNGYAAGVGLKGSSKQLAWGVRAGIKNNRDYLDGSDRFVPNSRFSQQSAKTYLNWNSEKGYFKLTYNYSHLQPGMTNGVSTALVSENDYEPTVWYQDLTNHMIQTNNTFFLNQYKINANASYNLNHRVLNTDEQNEVNMQLSSFNYDVRTWIPSANDNKLIVGVQGASRHNRNNEAHTRVLPNYTENEMAFMGLYQHTAYGKLSLQAGARFDYRDLFIPEQMKASHSHDEEESDHDEHGDDEEGDEDHEEELMLEQTYNYGNISASLGATYELTHYLLFRANIATAFRPPNVAELTQDGVHGSRYEVGNTDLESQRNIEGDLSLHFHKENFSIDIAAFYNHILNYIFLSPTKHFEEELQIYQYNQTNSTLTGGEINLRYHPLNWFEIYSSMSTIRGTQKNGQYLPFIPHDKIVVGVNVEQTELLFLQRPHVGVDLVYAFKQDRPSEFETATSSYSVLNLTAGGFVDLNGQIIQIRLNANNLLNTSYYDHLSLLKGVGYFNPGRNVAISLKYSF